MSLTARVRNYLHPTCAAIDCGDPIDPAEPTLDVNLDGPAAKALGLRRATFHGACADEAGLIVGSGEAGRLDPTAVDRALGFVLPEVPNPFEDD